MTRILALALACGISVILADAVLKTALALPQILGQAVAWRAEQ